MTIIVWREFFKPEVVEQLTKMGTLPREETNVDVRRKDGPGVARFLAEMSNKSDAEQFREGGAITILEPEQFAGDYDIIVDYEPVFYAYKK